jgi:hypothetical protein
MLSPGAAGAALGTSGGGDLKSPLYVFGFSQGAIIIFICESASDASAGGRRLGAARAAVS